MSEGPEANLNWLQFCFWAAICFVATCLFTYAPNAGGEIFAISNICIMVLSFFIGLGTLAGHRLAALAAAFATLFFWYLMVSVLKAGWINLGGFAISENLGLA